MSSACIFVAVASTLGCSNEGPSSAEIAAAEQAYIECMEEKGISIIEVSLNPNNFDVRWAPGDYTNAEAAAASAICEDRVAPLLGGKSMHASLEWCDFELGPASAAAGKLGAAFDHYDPISCTPDLTAWETTVRPVVEHRCGTCHGSEPSFGATIPLTTYDELTTGEPGNRLVDRLALRVASHTMPPPNSPQLDHSELDTLVEWATCGHVHPDGTVALQVDRPPYVRNVPSNLDLPSFTLLAPEFVVDRTIVDRYQCFAFDIPVQEERFLRRIQVSIDEARVLHHIVVAHDPQRLSEGRDSFECEDWPLEETPYLWAWAPGSGAFDFEDGGLRISPGERIVVQVHYNNGAGLDQAIDHSGIQVFHGPPEGRTWSLWAAGPVDFEVPEGESVACGESDPMETRIEVLAGLPHMHEQGAEFHSAVERADGSVEPLLGLTGWNFEAQRFYDFGITLQPGDKLRNWCGYRNTSGRPTAYGLATSDEMCYNFMYVREAP